MLSTIELFVLTSSIALLPYPAALNSTSLLHRFQCADVLRAKATSHSRYCYSTTGGSFSIVRFYGLVYNFAPAFLFCIKKKPKTRTDMEKAIVPQRSRLFGIRFASQMRSIVPKSPQIGRTSVRMMEILSDVPYSSFSIFGTQATSPSLIKLFPAVVRPITTRKASKASGIFFSSSLTSFGSLRCGFSKSFASFRRGKEKNHKSAVTVDRIAETKKNQR